MIQGVNKSKEIWTRLEPKRSQIIGMEILYWKMTVLNIKSYKYCQKLNSEKYYVMVSKTGWKISFLLMQKVFSKSWTGKK